MDNDPAALLATLRTQLAAGDAAAAEATFRALAPALGGPRADRAGAPGAARVLFDLGFALRRAGRIDAAEESYRHALRLADAAGDAGLAAACRNHLGNLYLDAGRLAPARAMYDAAAALRRDAVARLGDADDAAVYLAGALCNLGNVERAAGEYDAAARQYRAALAQLDRAVAAGARTREAPAFRQHIEQGLASVRAPLPYSLAQFRSATAEWGELPRPPASEPELAAALREPAAALARAARGVADDPDAWRAWRVIGLVEGGFCEDPPDGIRAYDGVRKERALDAFDHALLIVPDDPVARLFKASVLRSVAGAAESTYRSIAPTVRADLGAAREMELLGSLADLFHGAVRRAVQAFEQALRLAPDSADAWQELGLLYADLGPASADDARRALARAVALDPGRTTAVAQLARLGTGGSDAATKGS